MTTVEEDRAIAYLVNQRAILTKRRAYALGLMAPPGPRARVKAAWAPVLPDPGNPSLSARLASPPPIVPPLAGATIEGHGPPSSTAGLPPGATYLDVDTGNLYRLDP